MITERKYFIDWIRVIAIGLLLIYHVAIGFQPWGVMIGFITTPTPWESLWIPMAMLNIWRIPLLFFVSGMGVYFALQKRNWKELIGERATRILLPFIFGIFLIVPIHTYIWQYHYGLELDYTYDPGHPWFLGNIFAYVLILAPLFYYFKKNENARLFFLIKKLFSAPLGLLLVIASCLIEVLLVNPNPFELYSMTWHGFFLGLLAFFFGFCFIMSGSSFWQMLLRWKWLFWLISFLLFIIRFTKFTQFQPNVLISIESNFWIFTVFAFGYQFLNVPGKMLSYLSEAAYPVYILHMIFLFLGSEIIFPLDIPPPFQFVLVLTFTVIGSFTCYEFLIRRVNLIRPLFGLKGKMPSQKKSFSMLIRDKA